VTDPAIQLLTHRHIYFAGTLSWKLTGSACIDSHTAATNVTESERQQMADTTPAE